MAMSGVLVKQISQSKTGSLTPAGSLVKRWLHSLAGSITSTGTFTFVRGYGVALAGILTPSGSLARRIGKPLGGSLTATGLLTRSWLHLLSGGPYRGRGVDQTYQQTPRRVIYCHGTARSLGG